MVLKLIKKVIVRFHFGFLVLTVSFSLIYEAVAQSRHGRYIDHLSRAWYTTQIHNFIQFERSEEDGTEVEFSRIKHGLKNNENYLVLRRETGGEDVILRLYDTNGDFVIERQDSTIIAEGDTLEKIFYIVPERGYSDALNEKMVPDSLKKYLSDAVFGKETDLVTYRNDREESKETIPTSSWFPSAQKVWDDNAPPNSLQRGLWKKNPKNQNRRTRK